MLDTFQGLPVHSLIIHATVVVVPTAALMVALASVYPRFRVWIGPGPVIASLAAVVLDPLSTMSGHKLFDRIKRQGTSPDILKKINHHEALAGGLKYFVVLLALVAIASYLLYRRGEPSQQVVVLLAVLSIGIGVATIVDVALIGHAGAQAVWSGYVTH